VLLDFLPNPSKIDDFVEFVTKAAIAPVLGVVVVVFFFDKNRLIVSITS
jgi:hypothetical protein